jgi:hypothetical protein
MSRLRFLLAAWLLFCAVPAAAQVKLEKSGARHQKTTARDWLRHPTDGNYYTESWTVAARSKAGHIMYLNFLYSNIGVFAGSAAVNLSFRFPGREGKHYVFERTQGEWAQDDKIGRIGVGSNWMAFDGKTVEVRVKEKTVQMKLRLDAWTDGARLHGGKYGIAAGGKKHQVQVFNHVPRATVSGEVTVDGESFRFEGDAFIDHWVQTLLATDYCHRMWTVRFFHEDYTVSLLVQKPQKKIGGASIVQAMVTDRKGVVSFGAPLTLEGKDRKKDPKGHSYDTTYVVDYGGKGDKVRVTGTFKAGKLWDRDAVLDQLNAAQKQVVKWVAGNPVVYRLEGEADLTLTIDGTEKKLTGPVLMESIVLSEE